jgi:RNA-directed DNA polymerase
MIKKNKITIPSYDEIITMENLFKSFNSFRKNKKNKLDVIEFTVQLFTNISNLHADLQDGTYTHSTYKPRDIHKSSVRDRIVHHLLYHALYQYFDTKFIHDSYSCRINKGTHKALQRFKEFGRKCSHNNTKTVYILKCDIKKFFTSIDHRILLLILQKHIHDKKLCALLENIIHSFCTKSKMKSNLPYTGEHFFATGLPLGNLTSQLLVNIYMNKFDQFVKHQLKQKYYIRYADDFVFLAESKNELEKLLPLIRKFLWESLRLELHPDKVFTKTVASGVDFLGWVHFEKHRVLRMSTKRRMIRNLKDTQELGSIIAYRGMLSHGNTWKLQRQYLDLNK